MIDHLLAYALSIGMTFDVNAPPLQSGYNLGHTALLTPVSRLLQRRPGRGCRDGQGGFTSNAGGNGRAHWEHYSENRVTAEPWRGPDQVTTLNKLQPFMANLLNSKSDLSWRN